MSDFVFPAGIESVLRSFIREQIEQKKVAPFFQNRLLREDVFDLLSRFCIVVFYPIEEEENNGFHITDVPFADGSIKNFVYINTAQTLEKQVFTAAHELGHIWGVDQYIVDYYHWESDLTIELSEKIINRFAAVLLMPEDSFNSVLNGIASAMSVELNSMDTKQLLETAVLLMKQFFVPYKSVIMRMRELQLLDESKMYLLGNKLIPEALILEAVEMIVSAYGFTEFIEPTKKKWIEGLPDLLKRAEEQNLVTQEKIQWMRDKFSLTSVSVKDSIAEVTDRISVLPKEETNE